MPVYTDQTNAPSLLPEGDYIFEVTDYEVGMAKGAKTAGSDIYILKLNIEGKGNTIEERLIDHPSTLWKMDCFLKCCGVEILKGESYEFRKQIAEGTGVRFVKLEGLRGWCRIVVESYVKRDNSEGKANRVAIFYTDKEKLKPTAEYDGF